MKVEEAAAKQQVSANHMWIADTRAERHMIGLADWFTELKRLEKPVTIRAAVGGLTTSMAYGSATFKSEFNPSISFTVHEILLVLSLQVNILSGLPSR